MKLLIAKTDLQDYTRVSEQVADLLINPAIRDAHEFDVLPLLHTAEVLALSVYLADAGRPAFATAYKSAEEAGFPAADLAALQASPLYRPHVLYVGAVRPLLCYETYRRFLLDHGAHITENGVETFSSGNNQPIGQGQRTEMRADAAAKCSFYRAKIAGALATYRGPTYQPASCGASTNRRPGNGGLRTAPL